jgi:signal transduction histidine kinase
MSEPNSLLISTSSEFVALCQVQIILLSRSLGAVWSAVYLTETREGEETKLIPVVVYPPSENFEQKQITLSLLPDTLSRVESSPRLFSPTKSEGRQINQVDSDEQEEWGQHKHQLVVPLIYEDLVIGLLVTRRREREWNQEELAQVEKIARTIALARILDRRQILTQQQLTLQRKLRQLQNDRLDDFLHQLRNPLTALGTFVKLLLKRLLPEDSNYQITQNILREGDRLKDLLQDFSENWQLLDTQSPLLVSEQTPTSFLLPVNSLPLEPIKVTEIIEPLIVSAEAIAQEKNIHLTANFAPNLPLVSGNSKALREVINNLLDNALKYTPAGGKVQIQVGRQKSTAQGQMLAIEISDTGRGIPLEDRERIFERHYRGVQAQGPIAGTGLGLAIVKDLCEQMQAKIELVSPSLLKNKNFLPGTTVTVWLLVQPKELKEVK